MFSKSSYKSTNSSVIVAKTLQLNTPYNEGNILKDVLKKRINNDDQQRFKVINVTNELFEYKNLKCLEFHSLSEDYGDKNDDNNKLFYFKTMGYLCHYKHNREMIFLVELSNRSQSKLMTKDLIEELIDFFIKIKFEI